MRRLPPIKKSNRSRTLAFEPLFLRGSVMLPRDRVAFCTEGMPLPAAWPAACPRIPFGNDSYTFYCCTTGTRLLAPLSRSTHSATISALVRALSRLLRFTVGVKFIQYRFPKHRSLPHPLILPFIPPRCSSYSWQPLQQRQHLTVWTCLFPRLVSLALDNRQLPQLPCQVRATRASYNLPFCPVIFSLTLVLGNWGW